MEEIERACTAANAHSYISRLPDGYDTQVRDTSKPGHIDGWTNGNDRPAVMRLEAPLKLPIPIDRASVHMCSPLASSFIYSYGG